MTHMRVLFMATHIMWSINLDYLWLGDLPCIVVILPLVRKHPIFPIVYEHQILLVHSTVWVNYTIYNRLAAKNRWMSSIVW